MITAFNAFEAGAQPEEKKVGIWGERGGREGGETNFLNVIISKVLRD
jgi:hypothetical protein